MGVCVLRLPEVSLVMHQDEVKELTRQFVDIRFPTIYVLNKVCEAKQSPCLLLLFVLILGVLVARRT